VALGLQSTRHMIRNVRTITSLAMACALAVAFGLAVGSAPVAAADPIEPGRFVWRDLMTKDVSAAQRFYGELFGWRFERTKRGDRPYVIARAGSIPVAGIVDVSALPDASSQWLCFMAVADVDKTVALAQSDGGKVLVEPRDLPLARAAVVADPQGAPLGLAQMRGSIPQAAQPTPSHFFWQEYLAKDAAKALEFYKRLADYQPVISDTRLGVDYHVLMKARGGAGLFQLPATAVGIESNWLPYVLVDAPDQMAARVTALGGRILVPSAPEHRNGSLVVIADPGGAPLALQKYPY
jgi:predicted enzyme related to lactoylglutathione lyase